MIKLAQYFQVDEDWLLELAGHRGGARVEQEWSYKVQNPQLRALLTAENINTLCEATQRALLAILQSELHYQRQPLTKVNAITSPKERH